MHCSILLCITCEGAGLVEALRGTAIGLCSAADLHMHPAEA